MLTLGVGAIASPWIEELLPLPDFLGLRPVLGLTLLVLAVGTNTIAIRRLARGYRRLQMEEEPSTRPDESAPA